MEEKVSYDFSHSACRKDTNAEKYTLREELFGTVDVEPAWVADMDIDTPDFVLNAVRKRLDHPIIGYEEVPDSAFEAQCSWLEKRHGISYKRADMIYSHSVVASIRVAIEAFTKKGEGVIVQTPIYPPFFHSVLELERKFVKNPLKKREDGKYAFDIQDLKSKIDSDTKLLLLCSPHNPVGRVWTREELLSILEVCIENNIVVLADEVHSDLVYGENKHIPFASLSKAASDITLSTYGVGKTFNMAGFAMSSVAIHNQELKEKFLKAYNRIHFAQGSVLSHVAFEAAYKEGEYWLEDLKKHLYSNYLQLEELCHEYNEFLKLTPIEATYLAWIDCHGLELKDKKIREFFINEAKLGLNAGISFGREGSGYMRLNFAVSSAKMLLIIERLKTALENRRKSLGNN
ncbi:putative C-S lyase [Sulfurimonas aquatica]|uniref:cysteine-S-conjugate beta-lyase n=1 Tax=Sulfurimonas aquatica TaxID=2672570 RepID=A0A975GDL6_9BACT|nr:PatB family C-S lyase [Sulfurimonas aquatica]QSZ42444.1 putative C-S lyase [Sulfurimonas aquatica]